MQHSWHDAADTSGKLLYATIICAASKKMSCSKNDDLLGPCVSVNTMDSDRMTTKSSTFITYHLTFNVYQQIQCLSEKGFKVIATLTELSTS